MTPLEYAARCAAQYVFEFSLLKIKGPGHVKRVAVDRYKPFLKLLPSEKVCTDRIGGLVWFTSPEIERKYRLDLLSAGLNPDAEANQFYSNGNPYSHARSNVILSPKFWNVAQMILRLTGRLPECDPRRAARVAAILKARITRMVKGIADQVALTRAEEAAADAAVSEWVGEPVSETPSTL